MLDMSEAKGSEAEGHGPVEERRRPATWFQVLDYSSTVKEPLGRRGNGIDETKHVVDSW